MNRGELRQLIANMVEDPNQTKYTASKYNDGIEKAQIQFSLDSKALFDDYAIVMVAGTASYALPSDFMLEKMVVLNGVELKPISRATLQAKKGSERWDDDEGTPKYYIIDPEEDKKTITLYPKPDSTDAGTSLVLTYYQLPATLTGDTSIPLNGSTLMAQFHTGLAGYAGWLLMMYLQQTPEISQKRGEFYRLYTDKVNDAIQTFGNTKSEPLRFKVEDVRAR